MIIRLERVGPVLSLVTAVVLSACGAGASSSDPVPARSALPGLTGRDCRYAMPHDATPTLGSLARVGLRGNIALWGDGMGSADTVELSIRYAEDEQLQWVEAIRATVPADRVAALEQLVLRAMNEFGEPDSGVRVLVVAGDVAAVAPSVICDPEWIRASTVWANVPLSPELRRDFHMVRGRRFPVRVTLDERGNIRGVRLVRGTPSDAVDQYIVDLIRSSSFEPKLHDAIGVTTTWEFEIGFPRR